jgi:hypothetical protein
MVLVPGAAVPLLAPTMPAVATAASVMMLIRDDRRRSRQQRSD